jgi:hypothetical protein
MQLARLARILTGLRARIVPSRSSGHAPYRADGVLLTELAAGRSKGIAEVFRLGGTDRWRAGHHLARPQRLVDAREPGPAPARYRPRSGRRPFG